MENKKLPEENTRHPGEALHTRPNPHNEFDLSDEPIEVDATNDVEIIEHPNDEKGEAA